MLAQMFPSIHYRYFISRQSMAAFLHASIHAVKAESPSFSHSLTVASQHLASISLAIPA